MRNIFQKTIWAIVVVFGIATNDAKAEIDNPQNAKAGEIYRWEVNNPNYYDQLCEPENGVYGLYTYAVDQGDWDSQFFLVFADAVVPSGTKIHIKFDYRKGVGGAVSFNAQGHADPHSFVNNDGWNTLDCSYEWNTYDDTFLTNGEIRSFGLNCSIAREDGILLLRNIVVEVNEEVAIKTKETDANVAEGLVYWSEDGLLYKFVNNTAIIAGHLNQDSIITIPTTTTVNNYEYVVTGIGDAAFSGRSNLISITIPNSVTSIGMDAFKDCSRLISVTIPNSVTEIGDDAFYGCGNLDYTAYGNAFYIGNEENPYLVLVEAKNKKIESCNINSLCKFIYNRAFYGCINLTEISIPESVTNIGKGAFSGCSGLQKAGFASIGHLCGIKFTNSEANPLSLAHHLYVDTTEIKDLVVSDTVKSIGNYAFYGCSGLQSVTISNSVESIGNCSFQYCNKINSVIIPNSVETIGNSAFYNCNRLESVNIGNSIKSICANAFYSCSNLHKAEFASVESLCSIIFDNAESNPLCMAKCLYINGEQAVNLVIPETVESIGNYAFCNCASLASLIISDFVKNIGNYAFKGCSRLASVSIPNSVITIGQYAFGGCYGLKSLSYNSNAIGAHFNKICTLESIFIGDSIKSISGSEFDGCDNLVNVISMAAVPPTLNGDPYTYADTIWVPAASVEAYKAAPVWKRKEIVPIDYYTVSVEKTDTAYGYVIGEGNFAAKQAVTIYATPVDNYHFKAWSDGNTENPRTIILNTDIDVFAIFEGDERIVNINANSSISGSVISDIASYHYGDTVTITATANNGYHFVKWSDNVTDNPRNIIIDGDLAFTAIFEADENQGGNENNEGGNENQGGENQGGNNEGGNGNNPATAISDDAATAVNIYTTGKNIVVENATDEILVYNAMGALVCRDAINRVRTEIPLNTTGVYIVKTGGTVKRVVVN
ncbi:MAG: leucine-rich repeat domain-containing protein [Salinivirgaceae bacterium]|nr:leucine-rich repeat domain-containing protein [Salinivirgaceae bacterium]